jgi:4-amino-4-deoxy-L-arabinose transferase-like glycosyltransferase
MSARRLGASGRTAQWLPLACVVIAAMAFAVRLLAVAEPLGIDQSLWASAVRGMARGQLLYRDVWEQRPPGIYLTYLAGFSVFGWSAAAVVWLDVVASAATTVLIYAIARALAGRATASLAAALYAVLTMPAWQYSNGGFLERAICETFIVVCVGGATYCAVLMRRRVSMRTACIFGLLAGAAVLFKPNAALYFPALGVWGLAAVPRGPHRRATWTRASVVAVLSAVVLPAATVIWLWHIGVLADAKVAVIDFNRFYVSAGFEPSAYVVALAEAVWLRVKTDPLWCAGVIAAAASMWTVVRTRRLDDLAVAAVLWGGGALFVMVANGSRLFNSYFSQALAPLALLSAWWLMPAGTARPWRRVLAFATALIMLGLFVQRGYVARVGDAAMADAEALTGRLDRASYLERFGGYDNGRGYSARANDELAAYIRAHTSPDDRIFVFGINGAGVYFLADRLTAQRFLRVNFFVPDAFPNPDFTLGAVVDQLRVRRPRYLVFETLHKTSDAAVALAVDALPSQPLVHALLESYTRETRIEDFTVYRLTDDPPAR